MESIIFILAAATILFALISNKIRSSIISPPMLFTLAGTWVAAFAPYVIQQEQAKELLEVIAELTLVIVLFIDASRVRLPLLVKEFRLPLRLLGVGLPLTILFGAWIASFIFSNLSIWELALLSAILAPTDAALGQAVVSSPKIPERIRQTLNVESGLNDGIVLPLVILFASLASVNSHSDVSSLMIYWAQQVTLGPIVGIIVGGLGGLTLEKAKTAGWLDSSFEQLSGAALALLAWSCALLIGGNGFIAAFVAGMTFSCFADRIGSAMREFGEAEGQWLSLATFLLFGILFVVPAIESFRWDYLLYGILSLTLIRMAPVALSLIGLGFHWPTFLFLGWFGPRGLATLLFALLAIGKFELPHGDQIFDIGILVVLLSIAVHGLTALPGVYWYNKALQRVGNKDSLERKPTVQHRLKFKNLV